MSRLLEAKQEERQAKKNLEVLAAIEFELEGSTAHVGATLLGFSIKLSGIDCLLTLRADFDGVRKICFVGGPDIGGCLRKAVVSNYRNKLTWKDDAYR